MKYITTHNIFPTAIFFQNVPTYLHSLWGSLSKSHSNCERVTSRRVKYMTDAQYFSYRNFSQNVLSSYLYSLGRVICIFHQNVATILNVFGFHLEESNLWPKPNIFSATIFSRNLPTLYLYSLRKPPYKHVCYEFFPPPQ